jgi:hypothetical protein
MLGRLDQLRGQLRPHGSVPGPPDVGSVVLSPCQLLAASIMLAIALAITGVRTPHRQ